MAVRTLSHLYPTYLEAVQVVADLTAFGVPSADVSLIESETDARLPPEVMQDEARSPALSGLSIGAATGGAIGALFGVGAVSLSLIQPLVDLGWGVPLLVGAVIGGVVGLVIGSALKVGVRGKQAHIVAEALSQGQQLVMVRVEEAYIPQVQAVLDKPRVGGPPGPQPLYDEEPIPGEGSVDAARATIYREEERIQNESS